VAQETHTQTARIALVAAVAVIVAAAAAIVIYLAAGGSDSSSAPVVTTASQIRPAPVLTADDLTSEPRASWLTNGGTLANQRFSPLDEIDTSNVDQLKGVWLTHLRGSATAAKYSAEAQPIVDQGVMYVPTGADAVFAVSVSSGKIL